MGAAASPEAPAWGRGAWRDTHVHVEGPAVRQLQQAFARDWLEAGGGLLPESAFPTLEARGEARAGFVASTGSPSLSHSERMVQVLMAAARRRLWLTNACFVPTAATVDTLIRKARAGVDVRILVPGYEATSGVLAAQRASYERLLESGVRLWEYQSAPLHARTLVVDDQLTSVGSNNLEPNASALLEEGALIVEDAPLARALADSFERDLSGAVEIRRDTWRERGWLQRVGAPLPALGRRLPLSRYSGAQSGERPPHPGEPAFPLAARSIGQRTEAAPEGLGIQLARMRRDEIRAPALLPVGCLAVRL